MTLALQCDVCGRIVDGYADDFSVDACGATHMEVSARVRRPPGWHFHDPAGPNQWRIATCPRCLADEKRNRTLVDALLENEDEL